MQEQFGGGQHCSSRGTSSRRGPARQGENRVGERGPEFRRGDELVPDERGVAFHHKAPLAGRWLSVGRVGLGNMHQTAIAHGQTNGQQGGLLVESNTTLVRDKFVASPEFGATLAYRFSPCMQVHAGYSFLYWSNVARPENMIDNVRGDNTSIVFRDGTFWVQGFNAGLTLNFRRSTPPPAVVAALPLRR